MTSHDPLDLFRASLTSSTTPVLLTSVSEPSPTIPLAAYISFPQPSGEPINIPKDAPTRYTARADTRTEFYNIGQIWLAWTERESGVREYLAKGQASGVGYVGIADRRAVVEYLQGGDGGNRIIKVGDEGVSAEGLSSALDLSEAGPSRPAVPAKRKYEVDITDREFCRKLRSQEVELRDRNSVLRATAGGKINNFESFLKSVMSEKIRTLRKSLETGGKAQSSTQQPQTTYVKYTPSKKQRSSNPIIIISSSPTSLVTMWNVKKFLEQGVFEPSEISRANEAQQGNTRAEDMVPVLRKRSTPQGEVSSKYYVVDGVEALQKFGQDAWDRVVCVLTTGQAWQFKPYKWQDPKVLFRHVKGVYFQWSNEPVNPTVRDWNVTEMRIDRNKRHIDRQVVAEFWRVLDEAKKR
ncbi:parafibromin [Tremella mesenterica]|uniref:Parafibromin n=1 Tax=Tremella mesenterica TaxID=5217 RepID=A0A4Q1BFK8_TREME|nr:parafibromin [Tremella mesenterica]